MGAMRSAFSPATTITSSVNGWSARMAEERKVSPCQESKALSWPMRVEAPAARITPANDGAKRIEERYYRKATGNRPQATGDRIRPKARGNRQQQKQSLNHTFDYAQC